MQPEEVIFSPNAEKEIKKLTKQDQKRVLETLKRWRAGDKRVDIEKLRSQPDFFRIKIQGIRIVYYPLNSGRVVLLLIRDRKGVYRALAGLPERLDVAMRRLQLAG